jgi:hypothetical protein
MARDSNAIDNIRKNVGTELRKAAASCHQFLEQCRDAVRKAARRQSKVNRIHGAKIARALHEEASQPILEKSGDQQET